MAPAFARRRRVEVSMMFLASLAFVASFPSSGPALDITVDLRVELLAVVQYLSGYARTGLITQYDVDYKKAVEVAFGRRREHRAVRLFAEMSRHGFAFHAPVAAVLSFGPPPELLPVAKVSPEIEASAGSPAALAEFMEALRDFARETKFAEFTAAQ